MLYQVPMKTKNISTLVFLGALCLSGLTLSACGSSIKKADIASTANPTEEVNRLEADIATGADNQYDVLASKDFKASIESLNDAKEGLRKNDKQADILEDVAYGRAHLERATARAEQRAPKAQGVLDSRKAAMDAGAKSFAQLKDQLKDLDDDLRDNADNLDKKLSSKEFSQLQQGYQALELSAIQIAQIGDARAMVNSARNGRGKDNTPKSLKQAEMSLTNAENTIAANRHNPSAYQESVAKANLDAQFLNDVLATTVRKGSDLDEASAMKMVQQNNQIKKLQTDVGQANSTVGALKKTVNAKDRELRAANSSVGIQAAIENARTQFKADEAQAFQQGDKLLIRLNTIAFPSGRADLPASSLALLAKVKDIAKELNPTAITVEGHTDSVGGAQMNQTLSQKRASAVAQYFETNGLNDTKIESVGYGFKKPIATNKSAEGREQNRRVDVVITPGADSASTVQ